MWKDCPSSPYSAAIHTAYPFDLECQEQQRAQDMEDDIGPYFELQALNIFIEIQSPDGFIDFIKNRHWKEGLKNIDVKYFINWYLLDLAWSDQKICRIFYQPSPITSSHNKHTAQAATLHFNVKKWNFLQQHSICLDYF